MTAIKLEGEEARSETRGGHGRQGMMAGAEAGGRNDGCMNSERHGGGKKMNITRKREEGWIDGREDKSKE